jgi:cytohesin
MEHDAASMRVSCAVALGVLLCGVADAQQTRASRDMSCGTTPLLEAVRAGDVAAVDRSIRAGANVNEVTTTRPPPGPRGFAQVAWAGASCTPLTAAAEADVDTSRKAAIVTRLLDAGADVNAHAELGEYALHIAAWRGDADIVAILLARGADLRKEDARRQPAAIIGTANVKVIQLMVEAGLSDKQKSLALWYAAFNGHFLTVRYLLASGVPADSRFQYDNQTALMGAATREVAAALIKAGAEVNATDTRGATPLIHTAGRKDDVTVPVARVLIGAGADLNRQDASGNTPLIVAVTFERDRMIEVLLDAGADPNRRNHAGETALSVAEKKRFRGDIVERLIRAGAKSG